jgi:hypothetical protein
MCAVRACSCGFPQLRAGCQPAARDAQHLRELVAGQAVPGDEEQDPPVARREAGQHLADAVVRERLGVDVVRFLGHGRDRQRAQLAQVVGEHEACGLVEPGQLGAFGHVPPGAATRWISNRAKLVAVPASSLS